MDRKRTKSRNKTNDLKYKYDLLLDFIDHIPDVIYFKDGKGRFIMVNQAHAKGLGLKPEKVIGKTDFNIHPRERAQMMIRDDEYVMKTGKAIIDKIERATRADGVDNYVSTTKIPRYDSKGKVIGLMGITRDITRRMQLEHLQQEKAHIEKKMAALQELNKMKSEFVSIVSHELRTPLAIIKEATMLLLDNIADPVSEKQKGLLSKAYDNIERLKKIIDDLLDMSRLEGGRFTLDYSLVNLNDLFSDTSVFFKKLAAEKGISLNYKLPKKQINIFVDAERIHQVISNLIDNAIKFTEQDGMVIVEVDVLDTIIRVSVKDTGVGIPQSDISRLFNKFVQVSKESSAGKKGVGLGLSISKELVIRHGGLMWIESKLGVGSQFYFTLPLFYTEHILSKQMRDNINSMLKKKALFYLINLFIVNYEKFRKKSKLKSQRLFKDLGVLVGEFCNEFFGPKKLSLDVFPHDIESGEFSIVVPQVREEEVIEMCTLLGSKIKQYFREIIKEDIFVNVEFLPSFSRLLIDTPHSFIPNFHMKKVCIGLETRRFERVPRRLRAEVMYPGKRKELVNTVNISQGGVCLGSRQSLRENEYVKIGLKLPKLKKLIQVKARVAWVKSLQGQPNRNSIHCMVGIEFIALTNKDKNLLSRFVHSISSRSK